MSASLLTRCTNVYPFPQNGIMHIIMEFAAGGTLHKKIVNRDGELLPEDTVWEIFVQVRTPKMPLLLVCSAPTLALRVCCASAAPPSPLCGHRVYYSVTWG